MHQGQLATLRDVVTFYSTRAGAGDPGSSGERILKPLHLSPSEIDDLIAFLESLTDDAL
jgi:cytochrome c peroxidase